MVKTKQDKMKQTCCQNLEVERDKKKKKEKRKIKIRGSICSLNVGTAI